MPTITRSLRSQRHSQIPAVLPDDRILARYWRFGKSQRLTNIHRIPPAGYPEFECSVPSTSRTEAKLQFFGINVQMARERIVGLIVASNFVAYLQVMIYIFFQEGESSSSRGGQRGVSKNPVPLEGFRGIEGSLPPLLVCETGISGKATSPHVKTMKTIVLALLVISATIGTLRSENVAGCSKSMHKMMDAMPKCAGTCDLEFGDLVISNPSPLYSAMLVTGWLCPHLVLRILSHCLIQY